MDERTIIVKQGSVGSFLRGVAVGAALAMLLAPRSGRETRDMISEKGIEIKDKAYDVAKNTRDKAQTMVTDARDRAQTIVTDARDKFGASMKSASHSMGMTEDKEKDQLKRDLAISEEFENREFPL